ncbi:MAG: DnaJ family molecular chaperone [Pseudomonadota bacterium]
MAAWDFFSDAVQAVGSAGSDVFDKLRGAFGNGPQARQAAFSMAVVALAAKMAKADGVVTMAETTSFWTRFDVPDDAISPIRRLFDLAQKDVAGFEAYAQKIAKLFPEDEAVREDILDILYAIAAADGVLHEAEDAFLSRVADIFQLDGVRVNRVRARHLLPNIDPFAVLGLPSDANLETVRKRWRELVKEHHPDSLIARDVPPAFVKIATERLAAVNEAYEAIVRMYS